MRDAGPAADHAKARAAVEAREAELYRAQVAGDVDAIRPFLADDLIYIHSTGVAESKSAYLDGVTAKLYEYGMIRSRDKRISIHGDLAIVDGIVDMTVSAGGAPKVLIHLLFCLIWTLEQGDWRLRYRQATRTELDAAAHASP